jgi:hypothetical protein
MWSLAQTFDRLRPWLPAALAPEPGLERVLEVAQQLPADLTNCVFLERWLHDGSARLDMIVRVGRRGRARFATPGEGWDARLWTSCEWRRIAAFAREWATPGSRLDHEVESLWLEFDLDGRSPTEGPIVPRLFIDFVRPAEGRPAEAQRQLVHEALRPLHDDALDAGLDVPLRAIFESLPAGAAAPYLGLSLQGATRRTRVCVTGLKSDLVPYLRAIPWPGDADALDESLMAPIAETCGRRPSILHLDLDPGIAPRVGLEYAFSLAGQPQGRVRETALLDHVVARGWCSASNRDALLPWPGRTVEPLPHEIWHSRLMRRLSHLKLTWAHGEAVELKAYLCFFHELLRGGAVVGTRPVAFGADATEPSPTSRGK